MCQSMDKTLPKYDKSNHLVKENALIHGKIMTNPCRADPCQAVTKHQHQDEHPIEIKAHPTTTSNNHSPVEFSEMLETHCRPTVKHSSMY